MSGDSPVGRKGERGWLFSWYAAASSGQRRKGAEALPPLPRVEEGHFREVKTGVLQLPEERFEISPGRHSVVRRFFG